MIWHRLVLAAVLLVAYLPLLPCDDLYDSADALDFADHLYESNELELALWEYQRFLSLESGANAETANTEQYGYSLWRLSKISYIQNRYEKGIEWADRVIRETNTDEYRERAYALKIIMALFLGRTDDADQTILDADVDNLLSAERHTIFDVYRYVSSGDYQRASSILGPDQTTPRVQPLASRLESYAPKRPWLAAAYSTVLPGAGRVYTKQFSDGLVSFFLVGALAGITTYTTITEGPSSWRPWVFGGTTVVFYFSEIYGAYRSAERYESRQRQQIERAADAYLETAVP